VWLRNVVSALPAFLIQLHTRVANGGFGPGPAVNLPGYNVALLLPINETRPGLP